MVGEGWLSVSLWSVERKRRVGVSVRLLSCVCLFEVSVCDNYGSRSGASRPPITEESGRRHAAAPSGKKPTSFDRVCCCVDMNSCNNKDDSWVISAHVAAAHPHSLLPPEASWTGFHPFYWTRLCTAKSFLMIAYFRLSLASVHSAALL